METIKTETKKPSPKLVNLENSNSFIFSAKDVILAMIGEGYECIDLLLKNLENIGASAFFVTSKEDLENILKEMETEGLIVALWDTERVARNYLG